MVKHLAARLRKLIAPIFVPAKSGSFVKRKTLRRLLPQLLQDLRWPSIRHNTALRILEICCCIRAYLTCGTSTEADLPCLIFMLRFLKTFSFREQIVPSQTLAENGTKVATHSAPL